MGRALINVPARAKRGDMVPCTMTWSSGEWNNKPFPDSKYDPKLVKEAMAKNATA